MLYDMSQDPIKTRGTSHLMDYVYCHGYFWLIIFNEDGAHIVHLNQLCVL